MTDWTEVGLRPADDEAAFPGCEGCLGGGSMLPGMSREGTCMVIITIRNKEDVAERRFWRLLLKGPAAVKYRPEHPWKKMGGKK